MKVIRHFKSKPSGNTWLTENKWANRVRRGKILDDNKSAIENAEDLNEEYDMVIIGGDILVSGRLINSTKNMATPGSESGVQAVNSLIENEKILS